MKANTVSCPHSFTLGLTAQLKKVSSPSLFGNDIIDALLTAEYQTSNRFHFKVSKEFTAGHNSLDSAEVPFLRASLEETGRHLDLTWQDTLSGWFHFRNQNLQGQGLEAFPWATASKAALSTALQGSGLTQNSIFFSQITDFNEMRYEVPHENINLMNGTANESALSYYVEVINKPFSIRIMRKNNNRVLWAPHSLSIFEYRVPM